MSLGSSEEVSDYYGNSLAAACTTYTIPLSVGFEYPTLVGVSTVVWFNNYNTPLQGHLALTQDPTQMM